MLGNGGGRSSRTLAHDPRPSSSAWFATTVAGLTMALAACGPDDRALSTEVARQVEATVNVRIAATPTPEPTVASAPPVRRNEQSSPPRAEPSPTAVTVRGLLSVVGVRVGNSQYPADVIQNFMNTCVLTGGSQMICGCAIEEIQARYSYEQFVQFEAQMRRTGRTPQELADIGLQCRQKAR